MALEAEIERLFCWYVDRLGGKTWKFKSPSQNGVSDRIACLPGSTWFVELKAPKGRKAELQKLFATDMQLLYQNYACLWTTEQVTRWAALRVCDRTKTPPPTSSTSATVPLSSRPSARGKQH